MKSERSDSAKSGVCVEGCRILTREQVLRIDELLASLGQYGELHLIVQKGQLRYFNRVLSQKAWGEEAPSK